MVDFPNSVMYDSNEVTTKDEAIRADALRLAVFKYGAPARELIAAAKLFEAYLRGEHVDPPVPFDISKL